MKDCDRLDDIKTEKILPEVSKLIIVAENRISLANPSQRLLSKWSLAENGINLLCSLIGLTLKCR